MDCFACCALYGLGVFLLYKLVDWFIRLHRIGSLDQRYFLVTGCDTGFGNSITQKLDNMGCHVFATCFTEKGETELKKACSPRLKTLHMDVSKHESVLKGFQIVKDNLPSGKGLSGVINNAGIAGKIGPAEWLQIADYQQVFDVNLLGLIDVTTTFLPLIKKAKGRVVNTASVFGRHALTGSAPYTISKYGVEAFSDALRREMRPFKVSVHLIEPGFHKTCITDTDALRQSLRRSWEQASHEVKNQYGEEFLNKSEDAILKTFVEGIITKDISGVVNAYAHALTGLYPRARYVVGTDAKVFWLPVQYLPEWLGDWVLETMSRMSGAPMPAGAVQ